MRTATIRRRTDEIAPKGVFWVFVEDANAEDASVSDVPCRKIGALPNGGEVRFAIGNAATRVFVTLGENGDTQPEQYTIPAGEDDVALAGESRFEPATGIVFRFDGNPDVPAQTPQPNRKKSTLLTVLILVVTAALSAVVAGALVKGLMNRGKASQTDAEQDKTFTVRDLSITLTDAFTQADDDDTEASFESDYCGVYLFRDPFEYLPEIADWTLEEYAEAIMPDDAELKEKDGMPYLEYRYSDEETGNTYYYIVVPVKGRDAFWAVNFATVLDNAVRLRPSIFRWAKSVTFAD